MSINVRGFNDKDIISMIDIWNGVVEEGVAFPQTEFLNKETGLEFFNSQSFTGVAFEEDTGNIVGLYILHPNNIGRCGHISNASYAVKSSERGKKIGEILVTHCISKAKEIGFKILQFNAVVRSNTAALRLYEKLGFIKLGTIPRGFLLKDGSYEDIVVLYLSLCSKPKVAFICVHNSCRSQIAEALGKYYGSDLFESYSAGTETKPQINQDAVRLMKELYGIDMEKTQYSKLLSEIPKVDYVITMGCNVKCPYLPSKHREDWGLEDPTGKNDEEFKEVIAIIDRKVKDLILRIKQDNIVSN